MKKFSGVVVTFICLVVLTVPSWAVSGPDPDGDGGPGPWCAPGSQCCPGGEKPVESPSDFPCCYLCVRPVRTFGDINAPLTQFGYRSLMIAPVSFAVKSHDLDRVANADQLMPETTSGDKGRNQILMSPKTE